MTNNAVDRVQEFLDARDATAPQAGPGLAVTIGTDGRPVKLLAPDLRELVEKARAFEKYGDQRWLKPKVEGCSDCHYGTCSR